MPVTRPRRMPLAVRAGPRPSVSLGVPARSESQCQPQSRGIMAECTAVECDHSEIPSLTAESGSPRIRAHTGPGLSIPVLMLSQSIQSLLQFGNIYMPAGTCNSMPRWMPSQMWMPENSIDYEKHPECRQSPLHADAGDYAPAPP